MRSKLNLNPGRINNVISNPPLFVPIFNFARSPCSFLVLVTVGRHYDVRCVFFFGGARKSEKKENA